MTPDQPNDRNDTHPAEPDGTPSRDEEFRARIEAKMAVSAIKARGSVHGVARNVRIVGAIVLGLLGIVSMVTKFGYLFGRRLGESASSAEDCRSGKLLKVTGGFRFTIGGICTTDCAEDKECGPGLRCLEMNCVPRGNTALGKPCSAPWDCVGGLCVGTDGFPGFLDPDADLAPPKMQCSQHCNESEPCPDGFECDSFRDDSVCMARGTGTSLFDLLHRANIGSGLPH